MLALSICGTVEPFSSREKVLWEVTGRTGVHLETPLGIYLLRTVHGAEHLASVIACNLPTTLVEVDVFSLILQIGKLRFRKEVICPKFHSLKSVGEPLLEPRSV